MDTLHKGENDYGEDDDDDDNNNNNNNNNIRLKIYSTIILPVVSYWCEN
jgi:hypothetical protein